MKHLNAIFSGKYITPSLEAELGKLVPSMLPLNNKALIQYQLNTLLPGELLLNLPRTISSKQKQLLRSLSNPNHIFYTDIDETLNQSIKKILNFADKNEFDTISIIMGDTLIENYRWELNSYSFHETTTNYQWTKLDNENKVFSGYMYFDIKRVLELFNKSKSFILGIPSELIANSAQDQSGDWYDFGHYHNYHNSKKSFISHRYFNSLEATEFSLIKKSEQTKKIQAEANWYSSIPKQISYHCPKVFMSTDASYEIEHIYANTLSELLLFGDLPYDSWVKIGSKIIGLLKKFFDFKEDQPKNNTLKSFVLGKTKDRLLSSKNKHFDPQRQFIFHNRRSFNIEEMINFIDSAWVKQSGNYNIIHGDLCFSNILYDTRSQQLKLIDPRGLNNADEQTIYGYLEYDIAKLAHSFLYGYDFVIADWIVTNCDVRTNTLSSNYEEVFTPSLKFLINDICDEFEIPSEIIKLVTLNLFLSMIPLHKDSLNRQYSFLYIAAQIYFDLKDEVSCG